MKGNHCSLHNLIYLITKQNTLLTMKQHLQQHHKVLSSFSCKTSIVLNIDHSLALITTWIGPQTSLYWPSDQRGLALITAFNGLVLRPSWTGPQTSLYWLSDQRGLALIPALNGLALRPAWTGPHTSLYWPSYHFYFQSHQRGLALVDTVREKFGLPVLMGQIT
jgi:hypothetical protein